MTEDNDTSFFAVQRVLNGEWSIATITPFWQVSWSPAVPQMQVVTERLGGEFCAVHY